MQINILLDFMGETEGLSRQLLSLGPGESQGRGVSAVCELEVQPQAKVTEAWVGNIQSKARPQESHSHSQRVYPCEMVSTGSSRL